MNRLRKIDLTLEERKKYGRCMKGSLNPFYGKKHTDVARDKMSFAQSRWKQQISQRMMSNNPMKNPEIVAKVSKTLRDKEFNKSGGMFGKLHKEGRVLSHSMSDTTKEKLSNLMSIENPMFDPVRAAVVASKAKKRWGSPEYRLNFLSKNFYRKSPTFIEVRFTEIVRKYDLPFRFVGDKKFWIGPCKSGLCRNPDFIHKEYPEVKLAIEVCGWTSKKERLKRTDDYRDKGVKLLFLSKDMVMDKEEKIIDMVRNFLGEKL